MHYGRGRLLLTFILLFLPVDSGEGARREPGAYGGQEVHSATYRHSRPRKKDPHCEHGAGGRKEGEKCRSHDQLSEEVPW